MTGKKIKMGDQVIFHLEHKNWGCGVVVGTTATGGHYRVKLVEPCKEFKADEVILVGYHEIISVEAEERPTCDRCHSKAQVWREKDLEDRFVCHRAGCGHVIAPGESYVRVPDANWQELCAKYADEVDGLKRIVVKAISLLVAYDAPKEVRNRLKEQYLEVTGENYNEEDCSR